MGAVPGYKKGVRRCRGTGRSNGSIYVNGHPPICPHFRDQVLDFLKRINRPSTSKEIAAALCYSPGHTRNALSWMRRDGILESDGAGKRGPFHTLYGLPGQMPVDGILFEPTRRCGRCRRELPATMFHRDKSTPDGRSNRCRECRKNAYVSAESTRGGAA